MTLPPKIVPLSVESAQLLTEPSSQIPPDALEDVDNIYLSVDYSGDIGNCFADGKLVSDNFHNGTRWELELKQIRKERQTDQLYFLITPTRRSVQQPSETSAAMAYIPGSTETGMAVIHAIQAIPEYRFELALATD